MKLFADDLTVISSSKQQHEATLANVDRKCKDLGLQIRADKCVSMAFNGHSMINSTFSVGDGATMSINDQATKFLGCVLASRISNDNAQVRGDTNCGSINGISHKLSVFSSW